MPKPTPQRVTNPKKKVVETVSEILVLTIWTSRPKRLSVPNSAQIRKLLKVLVRSVEIEPTWAQGPGDFESDSRRIRPPP
jgi:hypothetical protein